MEDFLVNKSLEEIKVHSKEISDLFRYVQERDSQQPSQETQDEETMWSTRYPGEAASIITHHTSILRNKRLLLAYHMTRMEKMMDICWNRRTLPQFLKSSLSLEEQQVFKNYDKLLTKYMQDGPEGIGLDLTVDIYPPKDMDTLIRVLVDYDEVVVSIGSIFLKRGSVHLLPREEAERLIRDGIAEDITMLRD